MCDTATVFEGFIEWDQPLETGVTIHGRSAGSGEGGGSRFGVEDVRAAYDAVAADYAAAFPGTEPEASVDLAMIDHFVELVAVAGSTDVLDAGCGAGRMSRYLTDRGCRVRGIDLAPGMIEMARRDHPGLNFRTGSIDDLPYADDAFVGALYWYSVIHSPDDVLPAILAEAVRVVKPGGYVLVAFQAGSGSRDVAEGFRRMGHDVRLQRYHRSADQVSHALLRAGAGEVARLVREPLGHERDQQAFLVARAGDSAGTPSSWTAE